MENRLKQLEDMMGEFLEWRKAKEIQQIDNPLDLASRGVIGFKPEGLGNSALTQVYGVSGGAGGSVTAPKAYVRTVVVYIDNVRYELPSLI